MKKIILLSIVVILVLGTAAGAYWWSTRPQVITFSDDATLTLIGVDYGKRHTQPGSKTPKTTVATGRQPASRGSFTTATDTIVVWVQAKYDSQQYHYFQYYLYDKAGTACAQPYGQNYGGARQGNEVFAVQLNAFPRRQSKMYLRVQEQGNGGQELSEQKFVISNPAHGKSYTKWTPNPLPITKEEDDMSVTLTKLVASVDMPYQRIQDDAEDAANKGVQAVFHVERGGKPVTNWEPTTVETTDATGNRVNGGINGNQWQGNDDTITYQYGLWPDEPAWKLRVEFQQKSDFSSNELWAVQNIPLQPGRQQDFNNFGNNGRRQTNSVFAETDLNGYHVKIFPAIQFTDVPANQQPQGGLNVQITPSLKDGMHLTLVKLVDDQGGDLGKWDYGSYGNGTGTTYRYGLRDVAGATNVNLTITLNKGHFFEFTAKPAKPEK